MPTSRRCSWQERGWDAFLNIETGTAVILSNHKELLFDTTLLLYFMLSRMHPESGSRRLPIDISVSFTCSVRKVKHNCCGSSRRGFSLRQGVSSNILFPCQRLPNIWRWINMSIGWGTSQSGRWSCKCSTVDLNNASLPGSPSKFCCSEKKNHYRKEGGRHWRSVLLSPFIYPLFTWDLHVFGRRSS